MNTVEIIIIILLALFGLSFIISSPFIINAIEKKSLDKLVNAHGKITKVDITTETWDEWNYTTWVKNYSISGDNLQVSQTSAISCNYRVNETEFKNVSKLIISLEDGHVEALLGSR